jgi:hypothetical protein
VADDEELSEAARGLSEAARALADAVDEALPAWGERSVRRLLIAYRGAVTPDEASAARAAGVRARDHVMPRLRALLVQDVDEQRTNPLSIIRAAVRFPTEVLQEAGVPEVVRDEFSERSFPNDVYDLSPATWRDVDESVHEPGIVWGAWKAKTVLDRRRAEGRR